MRFSGKVVDYGDRGFAGFVADENIWNGSPPASAFRATRSPVDWAFDVVGRHHIEWQVRESVADGPIEWTAQ